MRTATLHLTKHKILRPSCAAADSKYAQEAPLSLSHNKYDTERLPPPPLSPPPAPPTPRGKSGLRLTPDRLWKTGTGCTRSGHLPTGLQSGRASIDLSVAAGCMALLAELGRSRAHSLTGSAWSAGSSDTHPRPAEQQVAHDMGGKGAREG